MRDRRPRYLRTRSGSKLALSLGDGARCSSNVAELDRHWPIGLLYDYHLASLNLSSKALGKQPELPLRVNLHLFGPPNDRLASSSIETCRSNFMNMIKEADYVRWGSTRRVTALRKVDQDALWDGVVEHDYSKFWSVASKLVSPSLATSQPSPSASPADSRPPDTNNMRSVPLRFYLPEGIPVIQDLVPPLTPDGAPTTLYDVLAVLFPTLVPPRSTDMTASFIATQRQLLRSAIVHGIEMPLDVHVSWLGTVMSGADGWCAVVLAL